MADVLATPMDPLQQIINVHWGGLWVHISASNSSLEGDMGVVIRKKGGKILAASSYQQSGGGGITTTTYSLWMPVDYGLDFGEETFFGEGGNTRKAQFKQDQFFSGDPLERRFQFFLHKPVGYLTLGDALDGLKAPDTSVSFNYINEETSRPWISPDALTFATEAEAETRKAELERIAALTNLIRPSTNANLYGAFGQYRVEPPGHSPPSNPSATDQHDGAWKQTYLITSRESTTDPQGFQVHNALIQVANSSDDEDVVFDVVLQGGLDSFDDPSWLLAIEVFTQTSGTRDGDGKLIKHTIVASSMGSFLIDPTDDPVWEFVVSTPDGNPFGVEAGTYSFALRRRPWNEADPEGRGGGNQTPPVTDPDGDPIPGQIVECFLTAPANYTWSTPLAAFTAEKSRRAFAGETTYPNIDYHNSNQPFPVGPPPLGQYIP